MCKDHETLEYRVGAEAISADGLCAEIPDFCQESRQHPPRQNSTHEGRRDGNIPGKSNVSVEAYCDLL